MGEGAKKFLTTLFTGLMHRVGLYDDYLRVRRHYIEYADLRGSMPRLILESEAAATVDSMPAPFNVPVPERDYVLGYSSNLLNNHYNYCKIARRMGRDARLFIDSSFQDPLVTSEPFWEELDMVLAGNDLGKEAVPTPGDWKDPDWVRRVSWRMEDRQRYRDMDHVSARALLETSGFRFDEFSTYEYFIYDNVSAHLELLREMNAVDIMQVSGTHVGVASYSQTPYVIYYYGSDAYEVPFRNNQMGKMQVRGIKRAKLHIARRHNREYLMGLGIPSRKIVPLPFIIDTDTYAPQSGTVLPGLRQEGKKTLFLAARQNWTQKGNDKLFRALGLLAAKRDDFTCLAAWYGPDTTRSQELVKELGIGHLVQLLGLSSKNRLRNIILSSDIVVDQFTLGLFGTLALEAMSCGRPVVSCLDRSMFTEENGIVGEGYDACPIVSAFTVEEIAEALEHLLDDDGERALLNEASRRWVLEYHGHAKLWPYYDEVYRRALAMP